MSLKQGTPRPHRTILPDPKFGNDMLPTSSTWLWSAGKTPPAIRCLRPIDPHRREKARARPAATPSRSCSRPLDTTEARGRGEIPAWVCGAPIRSPRPKFAPTAARPSHALGVIEPPRPAREIHGPSPCVRIDGRPLKIACRCSQRKDTHRMAEAPTRRVSHYPGKGPGGSPSRNSAPKARISNLSDVPAAAPVNSCGAKLIAHLRRSSMVF